MRVAGTRFIFGLAPVYFGIFMMFLIFSGSFPDTVDELHCLAKHIYCQIIYLSAQTEREMKLLLKRDDDIREFGERSHEGTGCVSHNVLVFKVIK